MQMRIADSAIIFVQRFTIKLIENDSQNNRKYKNKLEDFQISELKLNDESAPGERASSPEVSRHP